MSSLRVSELDLLRFLAALAVLFFHYSFRSAAPNAACEMSYPWLAPVAKYGYLGVELFFMISGFVILMSAECGRLRDFVVSRIVRLYPAFWACCTLTLIVTVAIGGPRFSASLNQYLINMTMMSGFFGVPSIDGVYWSLFVELQFYALVCVVLLLGRIHQAESFLIAWLVAAVVLEIVPIEELRWVLIADYASYFIAGATFFLIWSQGITKMRIATVALSWMLAAFQSLKHLRGFEGYYDTNMNGYVVVGIITAFFFVTLLVSLPS